MSDLNNSLSNESLRTLIAFSAAYSFTIDTNNPLEVVLPLFYPIATSLHGQIFETSRLATELATRYDLVVSDELCQYWMKTLIQNRLIVPVTDRFESGGYCWSQSNSATEAPGAFSNDLQAIILEMRNFINTTNDLLIQSYSDEQLVSILRYGVIGALFPKLYEQNVNHRSENQYIFGRFVQYCALSKPDIMNSISKLRRAAIYCDLILHLSTPRKPPKNTQMIFAYLDSSVVMDVIGLAGQRRKVFAERMLMSFKEMLFVPYINNGMISEIQNNIRALLSRSPNERYGPTADALRSGELKIEKVELILGRVSAVIEGTGIKIDRDFDHQDQSSFLTNDDKALLFSKLQSNYVSVVAVETDIQAVSGVFCKRKGISPGDLFLSKAIFITSNNMLAAISNKFFRDQKSYTKSTFPVVLTRSVLAALSDAIVGVDTSSSMSVADMLISAADATQYNVEVFEKIEQHLKELRPNDAEEYLAILSSPDYSRIAMDGVKGNPQNVTPATIREITKNIESTLDKVTKVKFKKKIDDIQKIHATSMSEFIRTKNDLLQKNMESINEIRTLHSQNTQLALDNFAKIKDRIDLIKKILSYSKYMTFVVVVALVYCATYFIHYLDLHRFLRFIISICVGFIAGIPFVDGKPLRQRLHEWVLSENNAKLVKNFEKFGFKIDSPLSKDVADLKNEMDIHLEEKINRLASRDVAQKRSSTLF